MCFCLCVLNHVQLFFTPWTTACQTSLSFTIFQSLIKFMSIESVMLSNHLILCHAFTFCPQSFPASESFPISQLFTLGDQSTGTSASASVLPMNIQGLISFRIDWLDLLAVQGTLKNLLQHLNSKALILSVLSLLYGPTFIIHDYWKNHVIDFPDLC